MPKKKKKKKKKKKNGKREEEKGIGRKGREGKGREGKGRRYEARARAEAGGRGVRECVRGTVEDDSESEAAVKGGGGVGSK